jgi:molecular chaperone HtpG
VKIPPFLEASYQSDHSLASFVSTAVGKIDGHISSNRLEFFPEYTDHSITHVELTLQTAFDLATGPARGLLTSADAAALTVAVGLHDLGMYLTRDGFESLIARGSRWKGVQYFDQRDWGTLWDDFYAEATRFDDRKLRQLFGEGYRPVRPLPPKKSAWDDFDNLLVGEFIRRHHPRLAHEIALHGLPAKEGKAIEVCPVDSEDHEFLADISGLIARSHGMDLRICLDYLQQKYQNKINPRRIHAAFLGTLLRIADYFQIQSARAPSSRTDVASFKSQLSEREWNVHQSIKDIHNTSGDPEAIVVIAEPADVQTFLKLKNWLDGLQGELDQSWAILGEVYGLQSHNNLNLLGMKIRRVKSNIDNVAAFSKTVSYVPARIIFEAANADLLKLLVAPLYGNNPGIGLRELIQNAVDAVREFDDLLIQHPDLSAVDRIKQETDVRIEVNCDKDDHPTEIIVTDRGVGMSPEVIRDYFLKAGASFRKSSVWRREHEDQEGHSRVLRTGRFGVGALAAYLLGDEIEVTTRHLFADPEHGIRFTARLDDEAISLDRVSFPVGTRISIKVPVNFREKVQKIMPYRWATEIRFDDEAGHYFLKRPSVSRHFTNRKDLPVKGWLPQPDDDVSADWRCFSNSDFEKVFWSFRHTYPQLACNGIVIESKDSRATLWEFLRLPKISVFDRDGRLPVNLQRTGLQDSLPFKDELLASMAEDICAHALTEAPGVCDERWFNGRYEGFALQAENVYNPEWARWLIAGPALFSTSQICWPPSNRERFSSQWEEGRDMRGGAK